nr:hypothetical protein [Bacteroidales bacterium]
ANPEAEKTVVFSAGEGMKKDFSYKEASELISKVKKIGLTLNALQKAQTTAATAATTATTTSDTTPQAATVETGSTETQPDPMTLNGLLTKYGIYGMLSQYERLLKKGERIKAKKLEDKMYEIEKKVSADKSIPKNLRERFVSYIENKEDEIEARCR